MTSSEQEQLWNGSSGQAWVESQELLDHVLAPFETLLVEAAAARSPRRLLDVGCGTGSTTLAIARRLGASARCTGIDISQPMLALATARAEREGSSAEFVRADAQTHAFEPASFDMIVSRFGTMFFDDSVRAFENLRRAAAKGAGLAVIVWRSAAENPFMTTAERAAAPFLPDMPARRPDEPGQFAFADRSRVYAILEKSGWSDIDIRPLDVECTLPRAELTTYLSKVGPASRAIQGLDERFHARVIETVRAAFDPFVHGTEVRFVAACWTVSARND